MKKTTVYLAEETERRMIAAAGRLGMSRAEMTREALEQYLDRCDAGRGLPESVGMGDNPRAAAADYEERLADAWGSR